MLPYLHYPPEASAEGARPSSQTEDGLLRFYGGAVGGVRTIVYVDGFNLYYGAVRGTPYLDLAALCRKLLRPEDEITAIKYFTAIVSARADDPDAPVRQQMYIRALATIPFLTVHYGHFLSNVVRMPLARSLHMGGRAHYVDVLKTEEKGSDVNLATHLLHDAHMDRFSLGIVVTNDSDLVEPIRIAREEIGKSGGNSESAEIPESDAANARGLLQINPSTSSAQQPVSVRNERRAGSVSQTCRLVT